MSPKRLYVVRCLTGRVQTFTVCIIEQTKWLVWTLNVDPRRLSTTWYTPQQCMIGLMAVVQAMVMLAEPFTWSTFCLKCNKNRYRLKIEWDALASVSVKLYISLTFIRGFILRRRQLSKMRKSCTRLEVLSSSLFWFVEVYRGHRSKIYRDKILVFFHLMTQHSYPSMEGIILYGPGGETILVRYLALIDHTVDVWLSTWHGVIKHFLKSHYKNDYMMFRNSLKNGYVYIDIEPSYIHRMTRIGCVE